VRAGGTAITVQNSGLEVWLYDEANRDAIRKPRGKKDRGGGGMPPDFSAKTKEGLVVGYSLLQDDAVTAAVYAGEPFTDEELSVGRWLEPQSAFLTLPSGSLCIESNDASRIGPETPGEKGALVKLPKGDYKLTLYRADQEALDREGIAWKGPQELILLTPGGKKSDAATDLLPFEQRRDTDWVGKYTIRGKAADALLWFDDFWDSFFLNLDAAAVAKLKLTPGAYFRTTVPRTGHALVSVYASNWEEARRFPRPDGVPLDEYGYAALLNFQDWNGAQGMFCRREKAKAIVKDKDVKTWLPCTVDVLDAKPQEVKATARGFTEATLADGDYFGASPEFLGLILSDLLPGVGDLDEFPLPAAVKRFDKEFGKLKLAPVGDVSWEEAIDDQPTEFTARLYAGRDDCFAAVIAQEMNIHVAFLTEREDGRWTLTGLLDDYQMTIERAESKRAKGSKTTIESLDAKLAAICKTHERSLEGENVKKAPATRDDAEGAFRRFLTAAFG
jgi:hypothetical protein